MLLVGRTILLVEDNALIRLDLAHVLESAGAHVLSASTLDLALELANCDGLSAAVLDFDLGSVDSSAVCWKLLDRGVPFLFHSGRVYSAFQQWPMAPVLLKPANAILASSVAALIG